MLLNRREDVAQIIKTIGTEAGVEKVRIYNKLGQISFSNDPAELNNVVDTQNEACVSCHSQSVLPVNLAKNKMLREYKLENGNSVLGLINPIENDPDCSSAACHEHSSDKKILGVLEVVVSTEAIDKILESNKKSVITNTLILMVIISSISGVFILFLVNRPLKKISEGITELSNGNLNYKIGIKSKDELGQVANEFNMMASKLNKAYREIKDWSETLNHKVEEKNTELKKIYEQISQIEKLASLGKLSAIVAHELNNPLEGILTYSKLISKKLSKQSSREDNNDLISYLSLISDESARCGKIVKDLLLFSHKNESEFSRNEISSILDKSLKLINHHLEINKIELIKEYNAYNLTAECDAEKIEQAFIAILINAIEAMNEGQTLKVQLDKTDDGAIIRIVDQGKGISEKDLPFIFEPFYSTKSEGKGTGLGLAVAYGIIKQHKGIISVEETSSEGTTFKITLPLNKILQEVQYEN